MSIDQHIAELATRLPQQRRCLVRQSAAVGQAFSRALTSPQALTIAAIGGAVVFWSWFRQTDIADGSCAESAVSPAGSWRHKVGAFAMAYLAHRLV